MDIEKTEDKTEEPSGIERMTRALETAIEGVERDSESRHAEAVIKFAESVGEHRSRRAPIQKKTDDEDEDEKEAPDGDVITARAFQIVGDARDGLYRRISGDAVSDVEKLTNFRAARNPRIDELGKQWARAVQSRDGGQRAALYDEMNDLYLGAMGVSRAALLSGLPSGENPLAVGSGASLLPLPLSNQLIVARDKAAKFRSLVNVFPMDTQTQRIPVLPTVVAASRLENAAYTDNTPAADHALLTAKDMGVEFSAGRNFLEDTSFNIVNQLTVVAGAAIGTEEDRQICVSDGTSGTITEGLEDATIIDVAETTTSSLGWEDIVALYYAVPQQYRANAKWFATSTTLVDLMQIVDVTNRPILLNAVEAPRGISDGDADAVGIIMGKAIYDVPLTDDVLFFGDPQWYALGQRTGIRVDADRNVSTGEQTFVIDQRIDGRVIPTGVVGTNVAWRKMIY